VKIHTPGLLKNKKIRYNVVAVLCAVLYWLIYCSLNIDTRFFQGISWKFRCLFLLALLSVAFLIAALLYRVIVLKDPFWRMACLSMTVQVVLMLSIFLIVYPGNWSWDDVSVLEYAKEYRFHGFQHFLTSVYMILCLYFLPSAAGATAIQAIVLGIISGWSIAKVEWEYLPRISAPGKVLLRLPFFLPPMLFHNYLFFRNVMCAYLELCLLVYAAAVFRSGMRKKDMIILSVMTVILASWRSENIYYLPFFFLYLFVVRNNRSCANTKEKRDGDDRQKKYTAFLLKTGICIMVCVAVAGVGKYNNRVIGTNNYSVLTSACPGLALYREAVKEPERNEKEISDIEKVLNRETMEAYPTAGGAELYWSADFINEYTSSEYSRYLAAVLRLTLRYPATFFKERWKIFVDSLGVNDQQVAYVKDAILMFREGSGFQELTGYSSLTKDKPIFPVLREKLLLFIGNLRNNLGLRVSHFYVWNLIPPMAFLVAGCIFFWIRKKRIESVCIFALLCKVPVLFLTAPASFFMYYISIYLTGYFLLFALLASLMKHS